MPRRYSWWFLALAAALTAIAVAARAYYRHTGARAMGRSSAASTSSSDPHILLAQADRYAWVLNSSKAAPLYFRAEELFDSQGDAANALHARIGFLRATAESGSFPQLSSYLAQQLQTSLVQSNPRLRLWCLVAKGSTDIELNVGAAKQDWEQAQVLADALGERGWSNRASGELGVIGFLQGDSGHAALLVGGALLRSILQGDVGGQIRYLELLGGGLTALNRNEEALRFFSRATHVAAKTPDAGFPFMAYEGKGQALMALGRLSEARATLSQALVEAEKEHKRGHRTQILILLGELALRSNDETAAIRYLEQAGQISEQAGFQRLATQAMFDLAGAYSQTGDLVKAEERLQAGLNASRQIGDRYFLPRQLEALAELQVKLGRFAEAHGAYQQGEDVIDGMLVHARGAYTESSLVSVASDLYVGDFQLETRRNDVAAAFSIIERARGRTAVDMLLSRSQTANVRDRAPTDANGQISALQAKLLQSNNAAERATLLDSLDDQEDELIYVSDSVAPSRHLRITHPIPLALAEASLSPDESILEYVLAEPNSYCLVITRDRALIVTLPAGQKAIEAAATSLIDSIRSERTATAQARQLYDWLINPVPAELRGTHLVIVPDGRLHLLPFECLENPSGKFLLQSTAVSYAPSTTTLFVLKEEHISRLAQVTFLGLGGVSYDTRAPMIARVSDHITRAVSRGLFDLAGVQLTNLPASRREVLDAGRSLGVPDPVFLLDSNATETAFKREPLDKFKIIHLAVHAFAPPESPERAALLLGRDPKSGDDGLLQTREIAALPLRADLVTLSACDTGTGKIEGEEGSLSLVQAFLFAGARSVLASLWSVDDSATAALMKEFYSGLGAGKDEASALRDAKLAVMSQSGRQSPPYWAGFTLVGYGDSPVR
ncbi:MAG TPA: CHAT domain-containing protein [Terriglobales bacterium]